MKKFETSGFHEICFSYISKEPAKASLLSKSRLFPSKMDLKVKIVICGKPDSLIDAFSNNWPALLGFKEEYYKKTVSRESLEVLKSQYLEREKDVEQEHPNVSGCYSVFCNMSIILNKILSAKLADINSCAIFNIKSDRIRYHWLNLLNFHILTSEDLLVPGKRIYYDWVMRELIGFNDELFLDDYDKITSKSLQSLFLRIKERYRFSDARVRYSQCCVKGLLNRKKILPVLADYFTDWVNKNFQPTSDERSYNDFLWGLVRNIGGRLGAEKLLVNECRNCGSNIAVNKRYCSDKCRKQFYNRCHYKKNSQILRKKNKLRMKELRDFYREHNIRKN